MAESPPTKTVLLVEDESDTRESLARSLARDGFRCLAAASAAEAMGLAKTDDFIDVVVTDIVLGRDHDAGLRLIGELRAAGILAPVVVITAFADVGKVKTALNRGAAHLLEKPFSASELLTVIRSVQEPGTGVQHAIEQVLARASLTDKEHEVALYLLQGLSGMEIADRSGNSLKTIRQHLTRIYDKCGVRSQAEFFRLVYPR